jgi:hypothetical protein
VVLFLEIYGQIDAAFQLKSLLARHIPLTGAVSDSLEVLAAKEMVQRAMRSVRHVYAQPHGYDKYTECSFSEQCTQTTLTSNNAEAHP